MMALYAIGYNQDGRFVTPEPLGPGGNPSPAMYGKPNPELLDALVQHTSRWSAVRGGSGGGDIIRQSNGRSNRIPGGAVSAR